VRAATSPATSAERLLVIDLAAGTFEDARPRELGSHLRRGDLVVVNDAATLPGSLAGHTGLGAEVELRLVAELGPGCFSGVIFGAGDYRTRTENRPAPARVSPGERLVFGGSLEAIVTGVSPLSPRLLSLRFDPAGDALWPALYARGRPIQYAHVPEPLELWSVQTAYAARPWAAEMPSAGRPLRMGLILELGRAGIDVKSLTHAAGLSATGDPALDAALPLPERYEIPEATLDAVLAARGRRARIVAVGTSVVRALEGCFARHGALRAGRGETGLVIRRGFERRVVDGLLTGMHERDASHFALLEAFAPAELLGRAYAHAEEQGYRGHEFGDATLILSRAIA
jgi:S-adenosylmethionine:tRNA ribosyltransferase-isomerase